MTRPASLAWLCRLWLIEAAVLWRTATGAWHVLSGASGPGSGGALFLLPIVPLLMLFSVVTVLTIYGVERARTFPLRLLQFTCIASLAGLVLAFPLVAGALWLFIMILGESTGAWTIACILALPLMWLATLIITWRADVKTYLAAANQDRSLLPSRLIFLAITAFSVVIAVLPDRAVEAHDAEAEAEAARVLAVSNVLQRDDADALDVDEAMRRVLPINTTTEDGLGDGLHIAIIDHRERCVKKLVTSVESLAPYIRYATEYGSDETWKIFTDAGADLANQDGLMGAVLRDDDGAVLKRVLGMGADKNFALMLVVAASELPTATRQKKVALLLALGADPNSVANPESPDAQHDPMILIAARNGDVDVVKQLLAAKADPAKKNADGKTALQVATEMGHEELIALLKNPG